MRSYSEKINSKHLTCWAKMSESNLCVRSWHVHQFVAMNAG